MLRGCSIAWILLTTSLASGGGDQGRGDVETGASMKLSRIPRCGLLPGLLYKDSCGTAYEHSSAVATCLIVVYLANPGRDGAAMPASSTARMPVRKMPSKVPA